MNSTHFEGRSQESIAVYHVLKRFQDENSPQPQFRPIDFLTSESLKNRIISIASQQTTPRHIDFDQSIFQLTQEDLRLLGSYFQNSLSPNISAINRILSPKPSSATKSLSELRLSTSPSKHTLLQLEDFEEAHNSASKLQQHCFEKPNSPLEPLLSVHNNSSRDLSPSPVISPSRPPPLNLSLGDDKEGAGGGGGGEGADEDDADETTSVLSYGDEEGLDFEGEKDGEDREEEVGVRAGLAPQREGSLLLRLQVNELDNLLHSSLQPPSISASLNFPAPSISPKNASLGAMRGCLNSGSKGLGGTGAGLGGTGLGGTPVRGQSGTPSSNNPRSSLGGSSSSSMLSPAPTSLSASRSSSLLVNPNVLASGSGQVSGGRPSGLGGGSSLSSSRAGSRAGPVEGRGSAEGRGSVSLFDDLKVTAVEDTPRDRHKEGEGDGRARVRSSSGLGDDLTISSDDEDDHLLSLSPPPSSSPSKPKEFPVIFPEKPSPEEGEGEGLDSSQDSVLVEMKSPSPAHSYALIFPDLPPSALPLSSPSLKKKPHPLKANDDGGEGEGEGERLSEKLDISPLRGRGEGREGRGDVSARLNDSEIDTLSLSTSIVPLSFEDETEGESKGRSVSRGRDTDMGERESTIKRRGHHLPSNPSPAPPSRPPSLLLPHPPTSSSYSIPSSSSLKGRRPSHPPPSSQSQPSLTSAPTLHPHPPTHPNPHPHPHPAPSSSIHSLMEDSLALLLSLESSSSSPSPSLSPQPSFSLLPISSSNTLSQPPLTNSTSASSSTSSSFLTCLSSSPFSSPLTTQHLPSDPSISTTRPSLNPVSSLPLSQPLSQTSTSHLLLTPQISRWEERERGSQALVGLQRQKIWSYAQNAQLQREVDLLQKQLNQLEALDKAMGYTPSTPFPLSASQFPISSPSHLPPPSQLLPSLLSTSGSSHSPSSTSISSFISSSQSVPMNENQHKPTNSPSHSLSHDLSIGPSPSGASGQGIGIGRGTRRRPPRPSLPSLASIPSLTNLNSPSPDKEIGKPNERERERERARERGRVVLEAIEAGSHPSSLNLLEGTGLEAEGARGRAVGARGRASKLEKLNYRRRHTYGEGDERNSEEAGKSVVGVGGAGVGVGGAGVGVEAEGEMDTDGEGGGGGGGGVSVQPRRGRGKGVVSRSNGRDREKEKEKEKEREREREREDSVEGEGRRARGLFQDSDSEMEASQSSFLHPLPALPSLKKEAVRGDDSDLETSSSSSSSAVPPPHQGSALGPGVVRGGLALVKGGGRGGRRGVGGGGGGRRLSRSTHSDSSDDEGKWEREREREKERGREGAAFETKGLPLSPEKMKIIDTATKFSSHSSSSSISVSSIPSPLSPIKVIRSIPVNEEEDKDRGRGRGREKGKEKEMEGEKERSKADSAGRVQESEARDRREWREGMESRWIEVSFLLRKPVESEEDLLYSLAAAEAGLIFIDQLNSVAQSLGILRGTLSRWILPYDLNTRIEDQSSTSLSVLESIPPNLKGKITERQIHYLVSGANSVRKLVRVKIADDNDLEQARLALRTSVGFFRRVQEEAGRTGRDQFQIFLEIKKGG